MAHANIDGMEDSQPGASLTSSSVGASVGPRLTSTGVAVYNGLKHRRLSSSSQVKKRISDARDAATRPSPVGLQTAAAALTALANLSLSSSPPLAPASTAISAVSASASLSIPRSRPSDTSAQRAGMARSISLDDEYIFSVHIQSPEYLTDGGDRNGAQDTKNDGNLAKNGKKRGTIFTCESCSKVYRHPSCLIKHRWEHSPHWREASKFLLSKHQQVQLMEAAAILSHMSPSALGGSSLPDDRSYWPSFLSGGLLPPPAVSAESTRAPALPRSAPFPAPYAARPASSSVPAPSALSSSRPASTRPRLHEYPIPGAGGVTHVRPGVLGVPTGSAGAREAVVGAVRTMSPYAHEGPRRASPGDGSEPWGSPVSLRPDSALSYSYARTDGGASASAWSVPRSSFVSVSASASASSRSRSMSVPGSDESEFVEVEAEAEAEDGLREHQPYGFSSRGRVSGSRYGLDEDAASGVGVGYSVKEEEEEEEEWDGMEMEMEL